MKYKGMLIKKITRHYGDQWVFIENGVQFPDEFSSPEECKVVIDWLGY